MRSTSYLWAVFILLNCLQGQVTSQVINVTLTPWADVETEIVLACTGATNVFSLAWARTEHNETNVNNAVLVYTVNAAGVVTPGVDIDTTRYEFGTSGDYPLTIKYVALEDEAKYWCRVTSSLTGNTLAANALLYIRVPADTNPPSFTYNGVSYNAGGNITVIAGRNVFLFILTGIKPKATFSWYLGGSPVTQGVLSSHSTDGRLVNSTSSLTLDLEVSSPPTQTLIVKATNDQLNPSMIDVDFTLNLIVNVPPNETLLSDSRGSIDDGDRVNVIQGTQFTFTCTVKRSRPAATIMWYLNNVGQESTPPTSTPGGGDALVDTSNDWTSTPNRANHEQAVKCEGSIAESQEPIPNSILTLAVIGPPDNPEINGSTPLITENEATDLTCQADLGYPNDWQLTWSNGTETITGPTTTPAASTDNRYRFTSTFTYTPKREDYDDTLSCAAERNGFPITPKGNYDIRNIQFCARTVRIGLCPDSHVIAGETQTFTCKSESSNPRTTLTWTGSSGADGATSYQPGGYGGEASVKPYNTGVLSKVHNGGVYTCTATNIGIISCTAEVTASCTLNVHYAPEFTGPPTVNPTDAVNEGGDVVLTCTVGANPKTNEIITWIKQDTGEYLTSSIYNDGTSTLTLIGITREQAGSYMCRANNGVPTADNNVFSDLVVVIVLYETSITSKGNNEEGVKSGENAQLTCIAKANPAPTIQWFDQNITAITNDTKPEKYTVVDTILSGDDTYGFVVSSVLMIKNVTSEDYGDYTCNSTNDIGIEDTHRITLNVTRIPNKPTNVQITNQNVSSLTVSWTSGYDGGEEQHFIIAHLKSETDETELGRSGKVTETTYTVTGLEPITQYEIRVYAENLVGPSTYGKAVAYTLPLPPDSDSDYDITFDPEKSTVTISGLTGDNGCIQLEVKYVNDLAWSMCGKCIETDNMVQLPGYCDQGRRKRQAMPTVVAVQSMLCYPVAGVCSEPFMVPEKDSGVTPKDQTGLIVGVTMGVLVLIIVIIVLLVYLRRMPRNKEKHDTSVELQTPSSMSTVESGRANGVNNEGMETNDEEAPNEVVALDSKPADTGDTYAVVNKEHKSKKREPANLPDVTYGVVEKKAQRKTPKGVKKYKPSSAAADETAFDAGDYEEVKIRQLKKPEKKDEDDTYANVGQQQDDGGRVVNEDGLIYAEVSHNKAHPADQPPIQTEESTLYASLDYKATKENKNSSEDGDQE